MTVTQASKFRNVILCEDIRDETGNRKSLMGVLSGDILVATLPAVIQIALFFQYHPDKNDAEDISIAMRFVDDKIEMMKGKTEGKSTGIITVAIPKGVATFEKETTFRVLVSVNGGAEEEILTKKVLVGAVS